MTESKQSTIRWHSVEVDSDGETYPVIAIYFDPISQNPLVNQVELDFAQDYPLPDNYQDTDAEGNPATIHIFFQRSSFDSIKAILQATTPDNPNENDRKESFAMFKLTYTPGSCDGNTKPMFSDAAILVDWPQQRKSPKTAGVK